MDEYDVYLNGKGYMLAKDGTGKLLAGTVQAQHTDPFTRLVSEGERWARRRFRFRDGAGAIVDDGGNRYAYGEHIDTRSGNLIRGPRHTATAGYGFEAWEQYDVDDATPGDYTLSNDAAHKDGWAVQFTTDTTPCSAVAILVKRHANTEYAGATSFTVELRVNTGNLPGAVVGAATVNMSPVSTRLHWLPHENLWMDETYFWLVCNFGTAVALGAAPQTLWLCVVNANATPIDWAYHQSAALKTRCAEWNGAAWSAQDPAEIPYYTVRYDADIDGFVRWLGSFRGVDTVRRVFAAVGRKVMYWDDANSQWACVNQHANVFDNEVLDCLDFNGRLYVATGINAAGPPDSGLFHFDGTTYPAYPALATNWVHVNAGANTKDAAFCLALHDNMIWKACGTYGSEVIGSKDGTSATWGSDVHPVGDPRTPISKLVSHGGKLYAAKPEGIFEITYPDDYPGAGKEATSNLIHDFRTDRVGRNFILDWHSALYFPGTGGIYEWKSSVLRDVWRERFTQDAEESPLWPIYDVQKGYFHMVAATTRGLLLGSFSPFIANTSQLWYYDGIYFHALSGSYYAGEPTYAGFLEDRGEGWGALWLGRGFDIHDLEWPNWTQDRSAESRCQFVSSVTATIPDFRFGEFDGGDSDTLKDWHELRVLSRDIGTAAGQGGTMEMFYNLLEGAGWVSLGVVDTSPQEILRFPANTTSHKIQIRGKINVAGNTVLDTPIIEGIDLLYQPLPETITQFHVTIRAADNQPLHKGGNDTRSAATIAAELVALLEETEPWAYRDDLGNSHCVRSSGVTQQGLKAEERPSGQGKGFRPEAAVMVSMLKVADTCPS
jgi:hypothetical protein